MDGSHDALLMMMVMMVCVWEWIWVDCSYLPFREKTVTTPTGAQYKGVEWAGSICGVSIVRAGESMEAGTQSLHVFLLRSQLIAHRVVSSQAFVLWPSRSGSARS